MSTADLHWALLDLAGWAPDAMLYTTRELLAADRRDDVERAIGFLTGIAERRPAAAQCFVYTSGPDGGSFADLTGPESPLDAVDRAAILATEDEAAGLWRVWRTPANGSPWPSPRRVYLVQARHEDPGRLAGLTGRMQQALLHAGEQHPLVEVFRDHTNLTLYHRSAIASSALLWADRPASRVRIAALFDPVGTVGGPGFAGRSTLAESERAQMLSYLNSGMPLFLTTTRMDDLIDPARQAAVPMGFRTDGMWIWSDATTYYLDEHGIVPDAELHAHICEQGGQIPKVDMVAAHRALAALRAAAEHPEDF